MQTFFAFALLVMSGFRVVEDKLQINKRVWSSRIPGASESGVHHQSETGKLSNQHASDQCPVHSRDQGETLGNDEHEGWWTRWTKCFQ